MTTEQKNEVIARFMGLKKTKTGNWIIGNVMGLPETRNSERIGYDSDFRMLMPACQKFVSENSRDQINFKACHLIAEILIDYLASKATILDIHQALYEGIEWLNKQQNKEV